MQLLGAIVLVALLIAAIYGLARMSKEQPLKAGLISVAVIGSVLLLIRAAGGFGGLIGSADFERVLNMLATTLISVLVCIGLWVGLNLFVNQARRRWSAFSSLVGATLGAGFFGILRGNRSVGPLLADVDPIFADSDPLLLNDAVGTGLIGHLEWPLIGALLFGGGAFVMKSIPNRIARLAVAVGVGGFAGWLVATNTRILQRPDPNFLAIIVATILFGALGALVTRSSGEPIRGGLIGAGIGWGVGGWLLSPFAVVVDVPFIATIVPLVLIMVGLGWQLAPSHKERALFDSRARALIFVGPALTFLLAALVVPAIRTGILSFQGRNGDEFVGFDNYQRLFTASDSFNVSDWASFFTSRLFYIALILLAIAAIVAVVSGIRRNGSASIEHGPTSVGAIVLALFLASFAALSVLRGTFFNNIWWVITVVTVATVAGTAIAVLSDRSQFGEKLAKSLIFMPMAISFVGASIVWRLQFQARPTSQNQTGSLNAAWVALGRLSNSGAPRIVMIVIFAALTAAFGWAIYRRFRADRPFTMLAIGLAFCGWITYRFIGPRLGGFTTNVQGELVPETIFFLTEQPFNNVWLMLILIWIQTGFAMVIISAAIKAVPQEFIESAKVDGATESDIFWRVTLPTILPTIGVVVTTLIVQVTKVFDIVAVAGLRGTFGNDVLANQMITESFQIGNVGFGASIAIVMFLLVLPVMVYNIYSLQRGDA